MIRAIAFMLIGLMMVLALSCSTKPRHPLLMQAVTNPRGEARITKRLAPCETVDPAPLQMEDDA